MKTILLTNDDGINAKGINIVRYILKQDYHVITVAPDQEQSGSSHSLTMTSPLRITDHGDDRYSVDGTPTDCVMLALDIILDDPPDLLVSGINYGQNMGDDVTYSGTVSAAFEGTLMKIPSIAVSLVIRGEKVRHFEMAARHTLEIVKQTVAQGMPDDTLLNVNIPNVPDEEIVGTVITKLGKRIYTDVINEKKDPHGRSYYWIAGKLIWETIPDSDFYAIDHKQISITPLHLDLTNYQAFDELKRWDLLK